MTIRDALYFSYAGKKSVDYGIINVTMSSGMYEESLAPSRSIQEVSIKGRDRPYFQGTKKDPLKFNVSFAFEDTWDTQKIREVTRWLTEQEYYQELYFTNDLGRDPERIFYALFVDDPVLVHNGIREGYVNLTVRCDSPYSYSPIFTSRLYKWDQHKYHLNVNNFNTGDKASTIVDIDDQLILKPHRTKWSDYASSMQWSDLNP
ncbi:phage tail domain-containing protein [Paenibacillus glucanolyticus]